MPTPQTLRELSYHGIERVLNNFKNGETYSTSIEQIQDALLSHFSTILEEVIGEDSRHIPVCNGPLGGEVCICGADDCNSLRQHQRIIGKDYLK